MIDPATLASLTALGLTDLEARIYTFLLQDSPVTGYGIAKALGKPATNVYKALSSLETKGAVEVDRGKTSFCRPVPAEQLLAGLERRFRSNRNQAAAGLQKLPGPGNDTRIYHLRDVDQVMDCCRSLIHSAKNLILVDLFLDPLHELAPDLMAAAAKGIPVTVKTYEPCTIDGVQIHLEPTHAEIRRRWPAQWVNLVVDGSAMLLAMLTADGKNVVQAIHSESPFLAWIHHSALGGEISYTAACNHLQKHVEPEHWARIEKINNRVNANQAPGYLRLRKQLERAGGVNLHNLPEDDLS